MKRFALAVLLMAAPFFASEATAQSEKLNPCSDIAGATVGKSNAEQLALITACRTAEPEKTFAQSVTPTPETAMKWAEASKGFAQALGIAAKELNIAANDFLDSPAGILLASVLVWNYAGDSVMGVFGIFVALGLTFFLLPFWWYVNRRIQLKEVDYEYIPVLWGAFQRRRVKSATWRWDSDEQMMTVFSGLATLVMLIVIWVCAF